MTQSRAFVIPLVALAACSGEPAADSTPQEIFVQVASLDESDLSGRWVGDGASGCDAPDFTISRDGMTERMGLAVAANFNGWDQTGRIGAERTQITFIDPTKHLPISLEGGGLRVRAPSDGLAVLGSRNIFDEGVLFRKCPD